MAIFSTANKNAVQKVLDATLAAGAVSAVLTEDVSALFPDTSAAHPCTFVIDRVDANGVLTPTKREYITFTGVTTATLTGLTRNADSSGSDQEHAVGAIVEFVSDVLWANSILDSAADLTSAQTLTNKTLTTPVINGAVTGTITPPITFYSTLGLAEGQMINGKIVPSVASNNLTVALKGMDGNDPSVTNPVYVMIAGAVRSIISATSFTLNAGQNYFNAGSSELATKEIDYFVYLSYVASDGTIAMLMSRYPFLLSYGDAGWDGNYVKESALPRAGTNPANTDNMVNIGRFAATLSAGAGYTWSVPTFTATNLIQRPIYETRWLTYVPTITCSGSMTIGSISSVSNGYKVIGRTMFFHNAFYGTTGGSASTQIIQTIPFTMAGNWYAPACFVIEGSNLCGQTGVIDSTHIYLSRYDLANFGIGATRGGSINGFVEI